MLVTFKSPIQKVSLTDNVATFTTLGIHEFTEGQSGRHRRMRDHHTTQQELFLA
jgi:hypothetical protein